MLKNQIRDETPGIGPTPQFATDADIECAQRLRHRLEERYLGHSEAFAELPAPLGEGQRSH